MKPIDLQVNILKSLDLVSEKARENILQNQIAHLEDESKKDRQSKDFHVPVNNETDEVKNKLPGHLPERKKPPREKEKQKKAKEKKEIEDISPESGEEEKIGHNLDIVG